MKNRLKWKKDFHVIIMILTGGIVLGIVISSAVMGKVCAESIGIGSLIGFLISLLCGVGNFTFLENFRSYPFTIFILIKSVYFAVVVLGAVLLRMALAGSEAAAKMEGKEFKIIIISVIITLVIGIVVNTFFLIRRLLGQGVLLNLLSGRYHKPIEEERIFMFLDIVSSTSIAEKVGHLKFHMLLNDFFCDITEAILESKGEIYKYIGDEVIITWKPEAGLRSANCVRVFFRITQSIELRRDYYMSTYGLTPEFRAGVHIGPAVIGEMGDFKREIAFLGDTVNTTARIQAATKDHGKPLLLSSELLDRLEIPEDWDTKDLGYIQLRGKQEETGLYSIDSNGVDKSLHLNPSRI